MSDRKRKRGVKLRSRKQHERHLEQKSKAKQERKNRKKTRRRGAFRFKTLWNYLWKLIVSVPILHRFFQFVWSFFKDS